MLSQLTLLRGEERRSVLDSEVSAFPACISQLFTKFVQRTVAAQCSNVCEFARSAPFQMFVGWEKKKLPHWSLASSTHLERMHQRTTDGHRCFRSALGVVRFEFPYNRFSVAILTKMRQLLNDTAVVFR